MTSDHPTAQDLASATSIVPKRSRSSSNSTSTEPFPTLSISTTSNNNSQNATASPSLPDKAPSSLQSLSLSPRFPDYEAQSPFKIATPDRAPSPLDLTPLGLLARPASSEPGSPAPPAPISEQELRRAEPLYLLSPARRDAIECTLESLETRVTELDVRRRRARELLERLYRAERTQRRKGLRSRYRHDDPAEEEDDDDVDDAVDSYSPPEGGAGVPNPNPKPTTPNPSQTIPHERFDRHNLEAGDDELKTWTRRIEYVVEATKKEGSLLRGVMRCGEWVRDAEVGSGVGKGEVRWLALVVEEFAECVIGGV